MRHVKKTVIAGVLASSIALIGRCGEKTVELKKEVGPNININMVEDTTNDELKKIYDNFIGDYDVENYTEVKDTIDLINNNYKKWII